MRAVGSLERLLGRVPRCRRIAFVGLGSLALASAGLAQGGLGVGGPGTVDLPFGIETRVVDSVDVSLDGSTGDPVRDAAILGSARAEVGLRDGDRLSRVLLDRLRARIAAIDGVVEVRTDLPQVSGDPQRARVRLEVVLERSKREGGTGGDADRPDAFPYIYRDRTGALRFILNGGHGAFSDGNPWFGNSAAFTANNPLVEDPAIGADTGSQATWVESWLELGLGGVEQIGSSNFAVYGAATGIAVGARGQDIFRDDPRQSFDLEKAYVGLLGATDDRSRRVDLTLGRQNFTLNDGFLISQFGSQSNAGPRPGVYLAPRTTHDFAAVGTLSFDEWTGTAFFLDPNEYEPLESDTQLAGANLRRNLTEDLYADVSFIQAVDSNTRYSAPSGQVGTRDGLQTFAGHLRWSDTDDSGVWVESEVAHQRHIDFEMDAWASYFSIGYIARDEPWTPSISYRFSAFTGDDPDTERYERFDSLFSGGLDQWLQGISLGKVLRPENRLSHRVRLNVAPHERLNLTLDWFLHTADELNNIGANPAISQLSSDDLGQELQLVARWSVTDSLYFLSVASAAFPGDALDGAAGGHADEWTTLQAQLFWSF